ncbi:MAG: hypothetical protein V3U80_01645, partial [Flavobacteriaceae bacterium]
NDVWYDYTTDAASAGLGITLDFNDGTFTADGVKFAIYSDCAGAASQLLCDNFNTTAVESLIYGATANTNYKIQVWTSDATTGTFGITINDYIAPDCATTPMPEDDAIDIVLTAGNVDVSWTAPTTGPAPTAYDVYSGTTAGTLTFKGTVDAPATTFTLTGLADSTEYFWRVQPYNGSAANATCDEWSFTTLTPACGAPTAPATDAVTETTAIVNWTAGPNTETTWDVEWGTPAFAAGTGAELGAATTTDNPFTITGLTHSTDYEYYVRANCSGDGTTVSDWTGPIAFTTVTPLPANDLCGAATDLVCDTTYTGSTASATDTDEETVTCGTSQGAPGVWFKYTGDDNTVTVDLSLSDFDTKVQVWSGACGTLTCVGGNDDGGTGATSLYEFGANTGTDYYVYVYGYGSNTGNFDLAVSCVAYPTDELDWYNLQHPASITMLVNDTGSQLDVYAQAYEPGVTNDGANPAVAGAGIEAWIGYGTTGSTPDDTWTWIAASYHGDTGNNDEYKINFGDDTPTPGTYDYASRFRLNGGPFTFGGTGGIWNSDSGTITVNPLPGDMACDAISLTVGAAATVGNNTDMSFETNEPNPACWNSTTTGNSVWYTFVANQANITVTTDYATGLDDTQVAVYTMTDCTNMTTFTEVGCDEDGGTVQNYNSIVDLTGLTVGDTYYVQVDGYGSATGEFNIALIGECTGDYTIWKDLGESGVSWSNGAPDANKYAVIDAEYNTDSGPIPAWSACGLTITNSGILNVNSGQAFTISNDIINNGQILVDKGGSVIQINDDATVTGTGTFDVEVITTPMADSRYSYFSSPTQTATMDVFSSWAQMNRNFKFDGTVQDWDYTSATEAMTAGVGYAVRPASDAAGVLTTPGPFTTNFDGAFNNGVITAPLYLDVAGAADPADDSSSLVGNPYPSAVNTALLFGDGLNADVNAFYFWDNDLTGVNSGTYTDQGYAVYNNGGNTNTPPTSIDVGQGFFAVASAANIGTMTFKNSMREASAGTFLRPTTSNLDKIWLNLTDANNTLSSQILIGFNPICSDAFDARYDARSFDLYNSIAMYSFGTGTDTDHLAIQTRGELDLNDTVVPLGISVSDASVTNLSISIDHLESLEHYDVYLIDHVENTTHNMKLADYNFTVSATGALDTRFELTFSRNALSTDNTVIESDDLLLINNEDNFTVKMRNGKIITNLQAFDILGKQVVDMNPNSSNFDVNTNLNQGTVLIIKATLENGQVVTKKFIRL